MKMHNELRLMSILAVLSVPLMMVNRAAAETAPAKRIIPWDVAALSKTPAIHATKERPAKGMRSFFYEGADYKGKPTLVFAYYAAPEGKPPEGGWPAVVCAHGGGGTAFPAWVRQWNKNGYAAIAMDLEGHLPGGKFFGVEGNFPADVGHENAGPKRIGWFGDIALPDREQWFYHAVADVIRANSLLRSNREINPEKIGLTGISWGGTSILCIRPFLPHGHGFGWEEAWEIGGFANGVVKGSAPMPKFGRPRVDPKDGLVHVKFTGELNRAALGFTTADEWKNQTLNTIPCSINKDEVIAGKPLPKGTTAFMIIGNGAGIWGDASVNSMLVEVRP
jgi:hypothetical protein